ncbi:hypothetical protein [Coleofasciculus sp. FACHB-SPT9]|uniref:hypothetical protein n=1 Tax=Coleofasciculus sp. FACHB-SPT9 TaxID=2692791 RepID=UPI001683393C|nr:hypothetical protein [Coleofasciculus sp. FACHB-SPT9]MBD1892399.1 hypothetical protein [Coleofasciculus sp. FACHB-SPT9]
MTFVNVTLLLILPEAIACEHLDLERAIASHHSSFTNLTNRYKLLLATSCQSRPERRHFHN